MNCNFLNIQYPNHQNLSFSLFRKRERYVVPFRYALVSCFH